MSGRLLVVLAVLAPVVLGGCAPHRSSRPCEEISAANLRALVEETTSLEQATTRVVETTAAEDLKIERAPDNPDHSSVSWRANGVQYKTVMLSPKVLWASMTYESDPPSADEVIRCLGAPDRYWAFYYPPYPGVSRRRSAVLNFYFPALGITCSGHKYGTGDRPPPFDGSVAMDMFYFAPLGPPDEVLKQLVEKGSPEGVERIWEEMKPWPGDWQEVEVQSGYD